MSSCAAVLGWDERTYMPRKGSAHRAEQIALLARMTHEMATSPIIGDLLGRALYAVKHLLLFAGQLHLMLPPDG